MSVKPYSSMKAVELGHAMIDVAHHPGLGDPLGLGDAGDAAMSARFLAKPIVDFHAPPLGDAHRAPVALAIVGDQAGANDADAMARRVAALQPQLRRPGIERLRRGPCGSKFAPNRAARSAPASDMAAIQSGGPPGCT